MNCTHCNAELSPGAAFCGDCGQPVQEDMGAEPENELASPPPAATCVHCGAELTPGAGFCGECGQPVAVRDTEPASTEEQAGDATSTCPHCGAALGPDARFCGDCGQPVLAEICTHCGAVLKPAASYCGDCGQPVAGSRRLPPRLPAQAVAPARGKSWLWLLALAGGLAILAVLAVVLILVPRFQNQPGEVIQVLATSTPTMTPMHVVVTSTATPTTVPAVETLIPTATAAPSASGPVEPGAGTPPTAPAPELSSAAASTSTPASSPEAGVVIVVEITAVATEISLTPSSWAPPPTNTVPAAAATNTSAATDMPVATNTPVATDAPPAPTQAAGPRAGRLAFTSNRHGNPEIYVADLGSGTARRLTSSPANEWIADWSPDGTSLAFTSNRRDGNYDTWTMDGNGGGAAPLVATDAWDEYARWSPNGQRLAFASTAQTDGVPNSEIFVRQASGDVQRLTFNNAENQWPDWSPDGRIVFNQGFKGTSDWDIWIMNADDQDPQPWMADPALDIHPTWSPDGQWIAFVRVVLDSNGDGSLDEKDAGDVWVGAANGSGVRQLTTGLWAGTPAWSPDSQWIAFAHSWDSNGDARMDGRDAANISAVRLEGGEPVSLVSSPHRDTDPAWTR